MGACILVSCLSINLFVRLSQYDFLRWTRCDQSASEVPARPPGSGYNFRSRSRSASTAPKNRHLGSVEIRGAGSLLDLPSITPPNSPTPHGAGNPQSDGNTEIPSPTLRTRNSTQSRLELKPIIPLPILQIPHWQISVVHRTDD